MRCVRRIAHQIRTAERESVRMLHVDIPTRADFSDLGSHRDPMSVSIYLPSTPVSRETLAIKTNLKNLSDEALKQLRDVHADKRRLSALAELFGDLLEDDEFWQFQAHSLAVFATPENIRTFRVPNALVSSVEVS